MTTAPAEASIAAGAPTPARPRSVLPLSQVPPAAVVQNPELEALRAELRVAKAQADRRRPRRKRARPQRQRGRHTEEEAASKPGAAVAEEPARPQEDDRISGEERRIERCRAQEKGSTCELDEIESRLVRANSRLAKELEIAAKRLKEVEARASEAEALAVAFAGNDGTSDIPWSAGNPRTDGVGEFSPPAATDHLQ